MYQKGDVVLLPFPFTDLTATKTRPAVVVSVSAFEQATCRQVYESRVD